MTLTQENAIMKKNPTQEPVLNAKEVAVLRACEDGPTTLDEMSKRFRRAKLEGQAHSWARNSVRKPVRLGLLKKQGRGTYGLTPKGRALIGAKAEA